MWREILKIFANKAFQFIHRHRQTPAFYYHKKNDSTTFFSSV